MRLQPQSNTDTGRRPKDSGHWTLRISNISSSNTELQRTLNPIRTPSKGGREAKHIAQVQLPGKATAQRVLRGEYGAFDTAQKGCLNINCEYVEEKQESAQKMRQKAQNETNVQTQKCRRRARQVGGEGIQRTGVGGGEGLTGEGQLGRAACMMRDASESNRFLDQWQIKTMYIYRNGLSQAVKRDKALES